MNKSFVKEIKAIINEIADLNYIDRVKYAIFLVCYELYGLNNYEKEHVFFHEYEKFNLRDDNTSRRISLTISKYANDINISDFIPASLYEELLTQNEKKSLGQVYTPHDIIQKMLNHVFKIKNICKNTAILDPACGGGYFLIELYKYIRKHRPEIDKRHIIENMLYGVDIDEFSIFLTKIGLLFQSGLSSGKFNVYYADFLTDTLNIGQFDIIIGNPPYVGHKNTDKEYKKVLYEKYSDVYYDKSDISYCFFKKGKESLKTDGIMSFITSRYFMEALYADKLRIFIKNNFNIVSLMDYNGNRAFKQVMVSPVIITLCDSWNKNMFTYVRKSEGDCEVYEYRQDKLKDYGWIILKDEEEIIFDKIDSISNTFLRNICTIKQGIITGCDKAFVISEEDIEKYEIESFLIRKWIKNSHISKSSIKYNNMHLIYSDIMENEKDCPNTIRYLSVYKNKLMNRRECLKGLRKWYELQWGRNKEDFENPKIVFPYKSKNNNFYYDTNGYFCSADVYIMNDFSSNVRVDYLTSYLNSEVFEFYLKCHAKKVGSDVYEYYPNKLNNLKIYLPQENIQQNFSNLGKFSIEIFTKKMFNIDDKEVNIIKKYIKKR